MNPPSDEAGQLTDSDVDTLLRMANDPEYMARVKATLDAIQARRNVRTVDARGGDGPPIEGAETTT